MQNRQTLCWNCQNAVPSRNKYCSWSLAFKPVDGWDAEATILYSESGKPIESYHVKACPKFEAVAKRKATERQRKEKKEPVQGVAYLLKPRKVQRNILEAGGEYLIFSNHHIAEHTKHYGIAVERAKNYPQKGGVCKHVIKIDGCYYTITQFCDRYDLEYQYVTTKIRTKRFTELFSEFKGVV